MGGGTVVDRNMSSRQRVQLEDTIQVKKNMGPNHGAVRMKDRKIERQQAKLATERTERENDGKNLRRAGAAVAVAAGIATAAHALHKHLSKGAKAKKAARMKKHSS
jgi:hypothetical protein